MNKNKKNIVTLIVILYNLNKKKLFAKKKLNKKSNAKKKFEKNTLDEKSKKKIVKRKFYNINKYYKANYNNIFR